MYEGFQRKEQTVAVAISLEDAYNKVQSKLLMDLLIQYGVSLTLTQWFTGSGALMERTVVVQLGNWSLELLISSQWAYHKDHLSSQSSSKSTPRAWQI